MSDTVVGIPKLPAVKDPAIRAWMQQMQQALEVRLGQRGSSLDRAVTLRELSEAGVVTVRAGGQVIQPGSGGVTIIDGGGGGTPYNPRDDYTVPNAPTALSAVGTPDYIVLTWEGGNQQNVNTTEIWHNTVNDLATATFIAANDNKVFAYEPGDTATHYFWFRFVTFTGVPSPYSAVVSGATDANGTNPSANELTVWTLTAAKATIGAGEIGSLEIGSVLQSSNYVPNRFGWRIDKTGSMEINSLTVHDTAGNVLMATGGSYLVNWSTVGGTGRPANGATRNSIFRQATAPTSGMVAGDFWVKNTHPVALYEFNGTSWLQTGDVTSANTAAAIANQGWFATLNQITSANASTYIQNAAITRAMIQALNVGYADILDAAVGTLKLAGNSVTVPVGVTATNAVNLGGASNTPAIIVEAWVSNPDPWYSQRVIVMGSASIEYASGASGSAYPVLQLQRGGTPLLQTAGSMISDGTESSRRTGVSLMCVDTLGPGASQVYYLSGWREAVTGGIALRAMSRSVVLMTAAR